jgi:polar amino acid transport system substrate-binding protein
MSMKSILIALSMLAVMSVSGNSQAQQTLKVGTNSNGAPWSFYNATTNTEQGVSVELIKEIAKDAGFQVQLVPMAFGELITALNSNKIDIIAANLLITPERQTLVAFSGPIAPGGDGLIVPKSDNKDYKTLDDLKGLGSAPKQDPLPLQCKNANCSPI